MVHALKLDFSCKKDHKSAPSALQNIDARHPLRHLNQELMREKCCKISFDYKAVFTKRNNNISFKSVWTKLNEYNETNG